MRGTTSATSNAMVGMSAHRNRARMPRVFQTGEERRIPYLGVRKGASLAWDALRDSIIVSVCSLDQMNILRIDPIKVSVARLESKRAAFAHLHTPHMDTRWLEFGWQFGNGRLGRSP